MQENERNRTNVPGSETNRMATGGTPMSTGEGPGQYGTGSDEWSRRQRYGAFYSNATERNRQRQGWQSRRPTRSEYEPGGWSTAGRTHQGGEASYDQSGFERSEGRGRSGGLGRAHTPRFAGGEQRSWEGRERGEYYGRGGEYGRGEFGRRGEERFEGEGGREWGAQGGMTQGYDTTMSGREFGREEHRTDYGRDYGREDFGREDQPSYGYYGRSESRTRRGRWQHESLTAREIMTSDPKTVTRECSLVDVAHLMKEEDTGIVPVVDAERKLQGVVTDRDIVIRAFAEAKNPGEVRVADVMTDDVDAVTPDEEVRDVIDLMGRKQVRRVPVVDRDDRLLGIISMSDIANRADYDEDLQEALEDISSKRSFWSRLWS